MVKLKTKQQLGIIFKKQEISNGLELNIKSYKKYKYKPFEMYGKVF